MLWAIDIDEMNSLLPEVYRKKFWEKKAYLFTVEMMGEMAGSIGQYDDDMHGSAMALPEPPSIDQRIVNQYSYFSVTPRGMDSIGVFGGRRHQGKSLTRLSEGRSRKWKRDIYL